ncbi:PaaI family thioesterase [Nocardioides litoris]|uniref:PaaI family thioesterase n=1 Tax=Nocardioides litoris TaxID=1926648 RepID=UPI001FE94755|nr:PaaI family thioesterase [Nocardioides litoris]
MPAGFEIDDLPAAEIDRQAELYGPFTDAVRELVDATVRTTVDDDEVRAVQAEVEALTARLRASQLPGSYGVRIGAEGRGRPWGNAVVGLRNPVAPPLRPVPDPDEPGRVTCDFHLGAAYEGPPTLVHGGVLALVLDQVLGEAAGAGGRPGMTGTLTLTYRRPTPLGDLRTEAWIERTEGHKTWARGHVVGPDGVTVEAEGVFILPRWARALVDERERRAASEVGD